MIVFMTTNELPKRKGLPDHLKILLDEYPRDAWSSHQNFSELTKFWLNRHVMFRKALETLHNEGNHFLEGERDPQRYATLISKVGGFFINELHNHHHMEDHHYFPLLIQQDERLTDGFALLDNDHTQLSELLERMAHSGSDLIGKIRSKSEASMYAADNLQKILTKFDGFMNRHLTDEEELIVPIILEYNPRISL